MDDPVQQLCSGVGRDGINGQQVGGIQSVREIPGFLALLVVYVLLVIREHRPAALSIILLGIGIAVAGLFPSYAGLLATTLLMSLGFYYFETVNQSLALQYSSKRTLPYRWYSAGSGAWLNLICSKPRLFLLIVIFFCVFTITHLVQIVDKAPIFS
jgi:hypothetical protein